MANLLDEMRKKYGDNNSSSEPKEENEEKSLLEQMREDYGNTGKSSEETNTEEPEYIGIINDFIDSYNAYASGFGGGEGYVSPETTLANKNDLLMLQNKYEKALAAFNENMDSFANVEQLQKLFDDFTENYRALTMANGIDRMYYDQWADEGEYNRDIQAFNEYAAEQKSLLGFDVDSAEAELARLQEQRAGIGSDYGDNIAQIVAGGMKKTPVDRNSGEKAELEERIHALIQKINLAKRAQNKSKLHSSAVNAADFEEYSQMAVPEEPVQIRPHQQNIQREDSAKKYMSEEQQAIFNYYYNRFGEEKAEEYIDSIRDELNEKKAQAIYEGNEGKVLPHLMMAGQAGLEQSKAGFQGTARAVLGDDSYQPSTEFDYYSEMAKEDLADFGEMPRWIQNVFGIESIGTLAYDMVQTGANMAPSIAAGIATAPFTAGLGGALAIGASAGGNTYTETLREGYSAEQARTYAVLSGASEAVLSSLLSGIGALGGKLTKKFVGKLVDVDGVLKRIAKTVPIKMGAEGLEEYLQEILDPFFRNAVLDENNEINLLSPEALYSFILGALSSGGYIAAETIGANYEAKQTYGEFQGDLVEKGIAAPEDSVAHKLAAIAKEKIEGGKDLSGRELRKLADANKEQEKAEATAGEAVAENATTTTEAKEKASSAGGKGLRVFVGKGNPVQDIQEYVKGFENATKDTPAQISSMYDPADGLSAEDFARGAEEAYRFGTYQYPIKNMEAEGTFSKSLPSEKRLQTYYIAKN
ncbi:MAG: hypothetical protein IIV40_00480, partial [Oscillospiraceae bacterium]|nr:hypothetical protein [Oscillospiraceae bacterium]